MVPRTDPETRPTMVPVQVIHRRRTDKYGTERSIKGTRDGTRARPMQTRNGLPVSPYRYRGTGQSDPELDARWVRDRRRREAR